MWRNKFKNPNKDRLNKVLFRLSFCCILKKKQGKKFIYFLNQNQYLPFYTMGKKQTKKSKFSKIEFFEWKFLSYT